MTPYFLFFFFVLGAIVASFMGVVAARLNTGESPLKGRSRCDSCGKPLAALDLVPLISYAFSGGRARCCSARLSYQAPLAELALGALYALAYAQLGLTLPLAVLLAALALLAALVLYDLAHMILPPTLLAPFAFLTALYAWLSAPTPQALLLTALVALILALIILALHLFSGGRAMGLMDAPLTFALALLAGPGAVNGFVYSFWIGAVIGIAILFARPKGSRMRVEVPFAPFLATGFLLASFTSWNLFASIGALLTGSPL